jgi:hypothetical protein
MADSVIFYLKTLVSTFAASLKALAQNIKTLVNGM